MRATFLAGRIIGATILTVGAASAVWAATGAAQQQTTHKEDANMNVVSHEGRYVVHYTNGSERALDCAVIAAGDDVTGPIARIANAGLDLVPDNIPPEVDAAMDAAAESGDFFFGSRLIEPGNEALIELFSPDGTRATNRSLGMQVAMFCSAVQASERSAEVTTNFDVTSVPPTTVIPSPGSSGSLNSGSFGS